MPKFFVRMERQVYQTGSVAVDADSEAEATEKAVRLAHEGKINPRWVSDDDFEPPVVLHVSELEVRP